MEPRVGTTTKRKTGLKLVAGRLDFMLCKSSSLTIFIKRIAQVLHEATYSVLPVKSANTISTFPICDQSAAFAFSTSCEERIAYVSPVLCEIYVLVLVALRASLVLVFISFAQSLALDIYHIPLNFNPFKSQVYLREMFTLTPALTGTPLAASCFTASFPEPPDDPATKTCTLEDGLSSIMH